LANAVDPADTERFVHGLGPGDARITGALLVETHPELRLPRMIGMQPFAECVRCREEPWWGAVLHAPTYSARRYSAACMMHLAVEGASMNDCARPNRKAHAQAPALLAPHYRRTDVRRGSSECAARRSRRAPRVRDQ